MFNTVKKNAKHMTWAFLRRAQRVALNSEIGENYRIDVRKMIVSLGAYSFYLFLEEKGEGVTSSQREKFLEYVFEYAPKYVHDLLGEYNLEQLPSNSFKDFYTNMIDECIKAENAGEDPGDTAFTETILYFAKDRYNDEENWDFIFDKYEDEIKNIMGFIYQNT